MPMRINYLKNAAFTLLEVLLAAIIFIISVGGVFATLNYVRQPVLEKERALTAAIMGKQFLESLRSQISAANLVNGVWQGNFALGTSSFTENDQQGTQYNISYTVSCADGTTTCGNYDTPLAVNLTVNWPDAQ